MLHWLGWVLMTETSPQNLNYFLVLYRKNILTSALKDSVQDSQRRWHTARCYSTMKPGKEDKNLIEPWLKKINHSAWQCSPCPNFQIIVRKRQCRRGWQKEHNDIVSRILMMLEIQGSFRFWFKGETTNLVQPKYWKGQKSMKEVGNVVSHSWIQSSESCNLTPTQHPVRRELNYYFLTLTYILWDNKENSK